MLPVRRSRGAQPSESNRAQPLAPGFKVQRLANDTPDQALSPCPGNAPRPIPAPFAKFHTSFRQKIIIPVVSNFSFYKKTLSP